ncbi:MAG: hypothetical protein JWS12_966 [Candidatus Saccharibacteria bacterium]|nr:hypothetical protein [Candidatus Saccharibacteria bacterium]
MNKIKKLKMLYLAATIVGAVGILFFGVLAPKAQAAVDPSKNYIYGNSFSDCNAADFVTTPATAQANNYHCIHFSTDTSTYTTGPTAGPHGETCARSPYAAEGGWQYNSKAFGILCAYFKPGTTVTQAGILDLGAAEDVGSFGFKKVTGNDTCGKGPRTQEVAINIGCLGDKYKAGDANATLNPITDAAFAIIRFLSIGVGIVLVASIVVAGIQYTTSQGNPQATANALKRIMSVGSALALYLLSYALLNWLVPGGLF